MEAKKSLILLFISCASTLTYAMEWDKQCLEDCFSTHHECNYCNYQCKLDGDRRTPYYSLNPYSCPLDNYNPSNY